MNENNSRNNDVDNSLQSSGLNILNEEVHVKTGIPIKQKKKKGIILTMIIIFLLVIAGGASWFYFNNPKIIFIKNLNNLYKQALQTIDQNSLSNEIFKNERIGLNSEIELSSQDLPEILNLPINKINLKVDYIENKKNEIGYLNLIAKINDSEEFQFEGLMKDKKIYFMLKEYFDKYYYDSYKFVSYLTDDKITKENTQYLLDILKANLMKDFKSMPINSEWTKIMVNDKEIRGQKTSLIFTRKVLANITINTINQIKSDNKAMIILEEILETTKEEINKQLDTYLESLKKEEIVNSEKEELTYNIYTKILGNKVKEELVFEDGNFEFITDNKDVNEYIITVDNKQVLNVKVTKINGKFKINGFVEDFNIYGELNKENFDFTIKNKKSTSSPMEINFSGINITKELTPGIKSENTFNVDVIIKTTENYKFSFKSKTEIESNKEVPNVYIKYSKKFDQITDEEILDIYTKLGESKLIQSFFNTFDPEEYNKPIINLQFF